MSADEHSPPVSESHAAGRAAPDVLELWAAALDASPAAIAFGAGAAPLEDARPWRIDLPEDPAAADMLLSDLEAQIDSSEHALAEAAGRLNTFVTTQQAAPSFSPTSPAATLGRPEAELLALLEEARTGTPATAFGLGEKIDEGLDTATARLREVVDRVLRAMTHFAWVETQIQGQLLCRTGISWTGDESSVWQANPDPAQIALHQRALNVAIASRNTFIRTFITAAGGAAKLSALLATPGGAVLALPAAWKFVNRVLDEIGKHQE